MVKSGNFFSELKLRAAYGKAGIQPGAFQRCDAEYKYYGDNVAFSYKVKYPNPWIECGSVKRNGNRHWYDNEWTEKTWLREFYFFVYILEQENR